MTTERQLTANRANGRKSKGPITVAGKTRVKYNARTHGILAEAAFIPGEDEELFNQLVDRVIGEFESLGIVDDLLADKLISDLWRLRRLRLVEAGLFARELLKDKAAKARDRALQAGADSRVVQIQMTQVGPDPGDRSFNLVELVPRQQAGEEADDASDPGVGRLIALADAFVSDALDANAFAKLARYQTPLERNLDRTLAEIQRRSDAVQTMSS